MDLLDELDDYSPSQFQKNQLVSTQQDENNEENNQSILGIDFNINSISDAFKTNEEQGEGDSVPDLSILERIKKRLAGESNTDETQKIESPPKKSFLVLPQLEVKESEYSTTQVIKSVVDATQKITHNTIDTTQVIPKPVLENLFVSDNEEEEAPLTEEEMKLKIAKLVEKKQRERQAKELEEDITKETLTDEENELNHEANDTVVSSHTKSDGLSTKELEKAQEFLNIQKRHVDIRPEFEKKVVFTKDKLLSAFSEDEDDDVPMQTNTRNERPPSSPTIEEVLRSSPFTSPVKEQQENILDMFHMKSKPKPKNPLEIYAEKLKQQLLSSPVNENTSKNSKRMINLDSDSDIDIASSSPIRNRSKSKFSSHAKELDVIPQLSKEQRLLIKQKFSKKKYQNSKNAPSNPHKETDFMRKLRQKNIDQLKLNKLNAPDHAIMEELEKDEQTMTSLLEREMERVRNIRKKEKLQEKAKLALLGDKSMGMKKDPNDDDYSEEVPDSDIAYSDIPESDYGSGEEDEDEEIEDESDSEGRKKSDVNPRSDDSYMFGGGDMNDDDNEEEITTTQNDRDESSNYEFQNDKNTVVVDRSTELFQNLQPRSKKDDSFVSTQDESSLLQISLPQFKDLTQDPTQTQVDATTQPDLAATQVDDVTTQKIHKPTQIVSKEIPQDVNDDEDDDDLITPATVRRGRKSIKNNMIKIEEDDEDLAEEEENEEDPEAIQRRIKEYELKIRKRELKARKQRKEMERKGLKTVIEGEAMESEDEWKGLGGADGEISDVANSEDERMIDNDFNIDLNNEEIRKKFMEDYQIKDQKELEKLLDDIKNHKLIKRVGVSNGLDIEISDEEDQLLEAYRKQRYMEQQQRLLQNKKLFEIYKNEKSKAFFKSIQDTIEVVKIDDSDSDVEVVENPFKDNQEDEEKTPEDEDSLEKEEPIKKTIKIDEAFVRKKLSFLYSTNDEEEYDRLQRMSKFQHGISDTEEDAVDVKTLRNKCVSNLTTSRASTPVETSQPSNKRELEVDTDVDDDEDSEFMPAFKKPSIVKSFRSFQEQQGISIKDGKQHFSGVTISKQYKVVSGSKASITYMSKTNKKLEVKSLKEKQIQRSINLSKGKSSGLFDDSGFE
ncbi:MRC1 Mediator of replication checkpoint protein 1 [Candida maltosa Xu316]